MSQGKIVNYWVERPNKTLLPLMTTIRVEDFTTLLETHISLAFTLFHLFCLRVEKRLKNTERLGRFSTGIISRPRKSELNGESTMIGFLTTGKKPITGLLFNLIPSRSVRLLQEATRL